MGILTVMVYRLRLCNENNPSLCFDKNIFQDGLTSCISILKKSFQVMKCNSVSCRSSQFPTAGSVMH